VSEQPLHVAFDVTPAISGRTGIARYVDQLARALERQGTDLRRFAVGRRTYPAPPGTRRLPVPARLLTPWWRAIRWPSAEQLAGGGDVVHATGLLVPPARRPLVVTVHDIAAVLHPELHPPRQVRQSRAQLAALQRAATILAVSHATARQLAQLGVSPERLVVAPLGLTPLPEPAHVAGLPDRYLLTVGETAPRKGYGVLLHALTLLDRDLGLVMVGPAAGDERRLRRLASALQVSSRIRRMGTVTDAALAGLYRGALALCFPSAAEGFGLPVLEAMAASLPVIAADIPAVRELAGDSALYVDAEDAAAWAQAIDGLAHDSPLRQRLAGTGRARAASYTWERTATATLEAYRLALETACSGSAG
jgi:glycosyltransferase involved in cell wall biosynthesis